MRGAAIRIAILFALLFVVTTSGQGIAGKLADKEKAKGDGSGPEVEPKEEVISSGGAKNRDQGRRKGGNRGRQGQGAWQAGEGKKGQQQGRGQAKGEKQKEIGRGQERSERGRKGGQGSVDEEVLLHFAAFSISKEPVASVSFPLSPQDEASFFAARELHKSKVQALRKLGNEARRNLKAGGRGKDGKDDASRLDDEAIVNIAIQGKSVRDAYFTAIRRAVEAGATPTAARMGLVLSFFNAATPSEKASAQDRAQHRPEGRRQRELDRMIKRNKEEMEMMDATASEHGKEALAREAVQDIADPLNFF